MIKIKHISKLHVTTVPEENLLQTTKDFIIKYEWEGTERAYRILKGFTYDGASIPLLRSDFQPRFLRAALVHDFMCLYLHYNDWTVEEMSELFGEILKHDNVGYIHAELMECAVTIYKSLF